MPMAAKNYSTRKYSYEARFSDAAVKIEHA
jgi:hypothetical protein